LIRHRPADAADALGSRRDRQAERAHHDDRGRSKETPHAHDSFSQRIEPGNAAGSSVRIHPTRITFCPDRGLSSRTLQSCPSIWICRGNLTVEARGKRMTVKDLEGLYDYNYWANGRLLQVVSRLTPEEFTRQVAGSYGSVRNTLVHV